MQTATRAPYFNHPTGSLGECIDEADKLAMDLAWNACKQADPLRQAEADRAMREAINHPLSRDS